MSKSLKCDYKADERLCFLLLSCGMWRTQHFNGLSVSVLRLQGLAGGLSVLCHPHTLAVTNRCVTSIGGFNDDWNGGDEGDCGILYKPHPL